MDMRVYTEDVLEVLKGHLAKKAFSMRRPLFVFLCGGASEKYHSREMVADLVSRHSESETKNVFCVTAENIAAMNVFQGMGRKVTVLELAPRLLPGLDRELGQSLAMLLKKRGAEIFTGVTVTGITQGQEGLVCTVHGASGEQQITGDRVLICTGRTPNTDGLFAPGLKLGLHRGFLPTDEYGETALAGIWAIGDVVLGGIALAHAAEAGAENAVSGMKKQFRIFALTLAVVVLAASFAGCGSSASSAASASTPAASSSAQGGKITIFQQKSEIYDQLVALAADYEKETGVQVEVWPIAGDDYYQNLKTYMSSESGPTVFSLNSKSEINEMSGYLADLSGLPVMYLPYDAEKGINPQDDSFLQKPVWDLAATPKENFPLLLHYHPLHLYRYQVCKQADTVMAYFVFEDLQSEEVMRRSFEYYEKITTHDSSLSNCIFSIVAARLGLYEKAWQYFGDSAQADLRNAHAAPASPLKRRSKK